MFLASFIKKTNNNWFQKINQQNKHMKSYDIDKAKDHYKATSCGRKIDQSKICSCCGREIEKERIPLCEDKIEFFFLGQGVPLFFEMLQYMIWMMIGFLLIFGLHALITNKYSNDCIDPNSYTYKQFLENCPNICQTLTFDADYYKILKILSIQTCDQICPVIDNVCIASNEFSLAYSNKQYNNAQQLIQSLLCLIFIFQEGNRNQLKESVIEHIYHLQISLVCQSGLPTEYEEIELKDQIEKYYMGKVVKINPAYNITEYVNLQTKKIELEAESENNQTEEQINKIKELTEQAKLEQEKILTLSIKTQIAFVTFLTSTQAQDFVDLNKKSLISRLILYFKSKCGYKNEDYFYFKDKLIHVQRAPEPTDIYWENCGYSTQFKTTIRTLTGFLTLFCLGVSFAALIGMERAQENLLDKKQSLIAVAFYSFLVSVIIAVINASLYTIITKLVFQEKQSTRTHYDLSVTHKLIYSQFVNSVMLTMATNILIYNIDQPIGRIIDQKYAFSRPGGIASDAFFICLMSAFLNPIMCYLDPFYVFQRLQRIFSSDKMTQLEANKLWENPTIYFYDCYTFLCKTIFVTFFFAPLVPIGIVFSAVGLFLYYWVQKYLLTRRYSIPPEESAQLNTDILESLDFAPILLAAGQLWLDHMFANNGAIYIIDYVSIALAGMEIILPTYKLSKYTYEKDDVSSDLKFEACESEFLTDYDRINPITQEKSKKIFAQKYQKLQGDQVQNTKEILEKYANRKADIRAIANFIMITKQNHKQTDKYGRTIPKQHYELAPIFDVNQNHQQIPVEQNVPQQQNPSNIQQYGNQNLYPQQQNPYPYQQNFQQQQLQHQQVNPQINQFPQLYPQQYVQYPQNLPSQQYGNQYRPPY
ncbi:hypothetical protein pb186bvf_001606 [Paramecium bursaria]